MKEHFFDFTAGTRRCIYSFIGLIAILIIYKHVAAGRIQTQRIEALEQQIEELRLYAEHSGTDWQISDRATDAEITPGYTTREKESTYYKKKNTPFPTPKTSSNQASSFVQNENSTAQKFKTPILVDLNEADSILLTHVPGIGEKTAAAIIRYRRRLGGYANVDQVKEAAKWVTDEQLEQWRGQWLTANPNRVERLRVNSADFKTLLRHPYLEYAQVKALFSLRNHQGHISSWEEILTTGVFSTNDEVRLRPYLTFN